MTRRYFYPRSPCGERPLVNMRNTLSPVFLSTLSLRRATDDHTTTNDGTTISIHALLAESDHRGLTLLYSIVDFYPRSPCGERLRGWTLNINGPIFLSTLSLRRATRKAFSIFLPIRISIHALLAESDCIIDIINNIIDDFYPRSPCGERQYLVRGQRPSWGISIHALLAESDLAGPSGPAFLYNFYPRSPCGERPAGVVCVILII